MANIKISDLPAAVAAQLAMEFEVNDNGTSRRVSGAQIDTLVLGSTNGFVARTGTNQRVARTLTAGSGVVVSHGNGATGNPSIALSTAAQTSLSKADNAVQPTRAVHTADGLTGGGDLSADRTLSLDGSVVRIARAVNTGTGLTGGGNLGADRTLSADIATQAEAEAGSVNTKVMTPLRVAQAIAVTPTVTSAKLYFMGQF